MMQLVYLMLVSLLVTGPPKPKPLLKIGVLYYANIDKNLKNQLSQNILATYHCTVTEIYGISTLPRPAYYKPCNRYRASVLLEHLHSYSGYDRVIGITTKDISTTKNKVYDWGIMGLANCPGKSCVFYGGSRRHYKKCG